MRRFLTWTWGRAEGAGGTGGGIASPPQAQQVKEGRTWCWNRGKWVIVSGWLTSPVLSIIFFIASRDSYRIINNKQKQQKKKGAHQTLPQWKNIPYLEWEAKGEICFESCLDYWLSSVLCCYLFVLSFVCLFHFLAITPHCSLSLSSPVFLFPTVFLVCLHVYRPFHLPSMTPYCSFISLTCWSIFFIPLFPYLPFYHCFIFFMWLLLTFPSLPYLLFNFPSLSSFPSLLSTLLLPLSSPSLSLIPSPLKVCLLGGVWK